MLYPAYDTKMSKTYGLWRQQYTNKAKFANQLPSKGYYCIGKSRSAKVAPANVAPAKVASCSAKVGRQKSQVAWQKLQKVVSVQKFSKQTKVLLRGGEKLQHSLPNCRSLRTAVKISTINKNPCSIISDKRKYNWLQRNIFGSVTDAWWLRIWIAFLC